MKLAHLTKYVLTLILILAVASPSWAQTPPQDQSTSQLSGTRRQIATIIFCGLGGAILGLSTLSFYGRPQDKLANIAVGFAVGIIGGTVFVTYRAATEPTEFYGGQKQGLYLRPENSRSAADLALRSSEPVAPTLQMNWTF